HEHPFSPTGIEGCVGEVKRLSIADLEFRGQAARNGTTTCFEYHSFAYVESDRAPLAAHYLRDCKCIIPQPASFSPPVSCSPARMIGLLAMMPGNLFPSSRNLLKKSGSLVRSTEEKSVMSSRPAISRTSLFTSNDGSDANFCVSWCYAANSSSRLRLL